MQFHFANFAGRKQVLGYKWRRTWLTQAEKGNSMLVVAIASQKGGSGKTTLCGHLAVEAEKNGFGPVALIDTDPQGSLSQWWNARVEKSPAFAKAGVSELESALQRLK